VHFLKCILYVQFSLHFVDSYFIMEIVGGHTRVSVSFIIPISGALHNEDAASFPVKNVNLLASVACLTSSPSNPFYSLMLIISGSALIMRIPKVRTGSLRVQTGWFPCT